MRKLAMAMATMMVCLAGAAYAARPGRPGSMVISGQPINTHETGWETQGAQKALAQKDGQWTLYFVAFLKKAPGEREINLVFYDQAVKVHEPVNAFAINTQPSAKILGSNITFGPDQGFKAGHSYDVLLTRLRNGKENVFARGKISLR